VSAASEPPGGGSVDDVERRRAVARRLRDARRAVGLTQKEVGERIGVARRSVYQWESGERLPTTALPDLAECYGVSTSFLLYGPGASEDVAELRADLLIVKDEIQMLVAEVKAGQQMIVELAEATERAFAELRRIVCGIGA